MASSPDDAPKAPSLQCAWGVGFSFQCQGFGVWS